MVTDTAKRKTQDFVPDSQKMNRVRPATNALFVALFVVLAAMAIIPVIFVFIVSISSETSIREVGYSFFPIELSNTAYMFLWNERSTILGALGISVLVTGVGTVLGLFLTTTMGYVLSRPVFKLKGFYTWVVFIPMIFNGGMLASYVINTSVLHLSDTVWSLILPLAVSSFNIIVCKSFFRSTIPDAIIESAKIDGANDREILFKIKIPMVMPSVTICTFLTLTNSFKLFDQNLSLTAGEPAKQSMMLAYNIYDTFYARSGPQWKGIGQAKAVVFFLFVVVISLLQLHFTRSKEVQA